jgi:hypothetical protein
MPPYILYALALVLYVWGACALWVGCAVLALVPKTREIARRAALSMVATFPGVFLAQGLVAPVVATWFVLGLLLVRLIDAGPTLESPVAIAATIIVLLVALAAVTAASLYGFYVGWMVMWRITGGVSRDAALRAHRPLARLLRWREERLRTR